MTSEEATILVEAMTVLPFFPFEQAARALISDELAAMCENAKQGMWLVRRLSQLYVKWPGMREVRAVYCAKFSPQDGLEVYSGVYEDGIPSENPNPYRPRISGRAPVEVIDPVADRELAELAAEITIRARIENAPRPRLLAARVEPAEPVTAEQAQEAREQFLERKLADYEAVKAEEKQA